MVMERETSHHHACTSHGIHCPMLKKSPNYPSPTPSIFQRNLSELSLSDLLQLTKQLKYPAITTLRLHVSPEEQLSVSQRFGDADQRTTDTLFAFTRSLAHAIEGWMQNLELGVCSGLRDINTLCPAIRCTRSLRYLSFANSGLGDVTLQVLSLALQYCLPLQTLNLSGCALTDASSSVITTIVKGEDPNARSLPQKLKETTPAAEHRAPIYGQQWRQNVILRGKWSPAPVPEEFVSPKNEADWEATLRKPTMVGSNRRESQPAKASNVGLLALDLSCNSFTDVLSEDLCPVLYKGPPLRALNLRCNHMTRLGGKPLLDVMKELNILRLVDMRGNTDENLLGVLENGEHYTTFSTFQTPFWMDPESLDPIICNSMKSRSNTPAKRPRFTTSPSRSCLPAEKQTKATIAGQHAITVKGGGASRNLSPQNSFNRANNGGGGSRNNTPSRANNTPRANNSPLKASNTSPSRANTSPSCSGASVSRGALAADQWGPNWQQKRHHYHCSHQGSGPYVYSQENEEMSDLNDHNVSKRFILAPRKERPAATSSFVRNSALRSAWPKKNTTFFDQTTGYNKKPNISPSRDQEFCDGSRFMSPTALELPREWDTSTTPHEVDNMRDVVLHGSKDSEGLRSRYPSEGKMAQSAGYNVHGQGYPRDYSNLDIYREYGHHNCYRNFSASGSPSRRWSASTGWNHGRADSQGKRSPEKSPILCHHRCKLLNEVQELKKNRSKAVAKAVAEEHVFTPHFHHQSLPKSAPALTEDKKELVEWNNFVNQMTQALLHLKDGLDQLIGPTEGAVATVAQQAAAKLHQMPSSFFRSGMLHQLERSCRVLNSHVTSLTKRHKENMRHINAENQAPVPSGEATTKKESSKEATKNQEAAGKQDKNHKTLLRSNNVKQLGVHNSNQQHRLIYHSNLPPLSISKGPNNPPSQAIK